ncbi:dethiobiotin synthase [Moraxella osloensis]|nr:dethiobiotin synthase [Moraxella osloensis]MBW4009828.1 dethiobiotin synthase [Moraxella osloensis]
MNLSNVNDAASSLNGAYFVTGTDTEIGKTTTTAQLVKNIAQQGKSVYAIKPVTAGLETDDNGQPYSDDARRINQFANVKPPLSAIAPIQLATPCSPHIAAQIDDVTLTNTQLVDTIHNAIAAYPADVILVEGAGGWLTPINEQETLADVAAALKYPVILVVGIKLGSLNHAMLTLQAIWQAGLKVASVIFNQLQTDTPFVDAQIDWLSQQILRQSTGYQNKPPLMIKQGVLTD